MAENAPITELLESIARVESSVGVLLPARRSVVVAEASSVAAAAADDEEDEEADEPPLPRVELALRLIPG